MKISEMEKTTVTDTNMDSPPLKGGRVKERKEGTYSTTDPGLIPDDIIMNILSRIPGSSLVRFKSVCKLWNSWTYDPYFINLHLDHATRVDPRRIILFSRDLEQGEIEYHLTLLDETWRPKYKLTTPFPITFAAPPCNGLICLYGLDENITLCNPTTLEFLTLPKPPPLYSKYLRIGILRCCFGFHHVTMEYKVVLFSRLWVNRPMKSYDQMVEVFNLGKNSWRHIREIDCDLRGPGINVHGSIFWTMVDSDQIIEFDLKDDSFGSISPPDYSKWEIEVSAAEISLFQLEGNLCLVRLPDGSPVPMDIWMLKDYSNNLWIHQCRIPLHSVSSEYRRQLNPIIIYSERILLRSRTSLWLYPHRSLPETFEMVYRDEELGYSARVFAFVESLVSLRNQRNSNG